MEMKRFEIASYDEALAIRPDYATALNNRGRALSALRHFDEAVISYDKALASKPGFRRRCRRSRQCAARTDAVRGSTRSVCAIALRPARYRDAVDPGIALAALQALDEALESCNRTARARPGQSQGAHSPRCAPAR